MDSKATLGGTVIYTDPRGVDHEALVTAVWSEMCVNVVYVSNDESERDDYGRQIKRETSVSYALATGAAHGRVYRLPGQPKPEYNPPVAA